MTNQLSPETLRIDMDEKTHPYPNLIKAWLSTKEHFKDLKRKVNCSCRGPNEVPFHVGGECIKCHKRVINHAIR